MRTTFQDELNLLESTLQEEGALVLRALRGALNALEQRDSELADEVIAFDDDVDDRYLRIEEGIQSLLARQTPVASDLRLVLAMLHVNLHLERMADYCVTIAKLSKLVPDVDPGPRFVEGFEEMRPRCEEMIRVALDSFGNRDLAGAESLVELDELIDLANRPNVERSPPCLRSQRRTPFRPRISSFTCAPSSPPTTPSCVTSRRPSTRAIGSRASSSICSTGRS